MVRARERGEAWSSPHSLGYDRPYRCSPSGISFEKVPSEFFLRL
jgi:hypothetical protein